MNSLRDFSQLQSQLYGNLHKLRQTAAIRRRFHKARFCLPGCLYLIYAGVVYSYYLTPCFKLRTKCWYICKENLFIRLFSFEKGFNFDFHMISFFLLLDFFMKWVGCTLDGKGHAVLYQLKTLMLYVALVITLVKAFPFIHEK